MKIRSVLLGSVAVAGLAGSGYAADLGVVTSLDVCDELGLSGLHISSDDNCLVITGNVAFEYDVGDYNPGIVFGNYAYNPGHNTYTVLNPNSALDSNLGDVDSWLKFVGNADSDFGLATATIKLVSNNVRGTGNWNGTPLVAVPVPPAPAPGFAAVGQSFGRLIGLGEAWVGIGDTTQIMAGYKSSIFNKGDDVPLNYLGLFNSSSVNTGVLWSKAAGGATGGDVIQIVSNLGNGLSIAGGLENLGIGNNASGTNITGTVLSGVGTIQYSGEGLSAHASGAVDTTGKWRAHAGFTGAWDPIKVVGRLRLIRLVGGMPSAPCRRPSTCSLSRRLEKLRRPVSGVSAVRPQRLLPTV